MSNAMVVFNADEFDVIQRMAKAMVSSGYFNDTKEVAQAIVKIQAGRELGLPPFASMTGIHVIQSKPVFGSNIIATLVKNDPRYDYRVASCDNKAAVLVWFENGAAVGESSFTFDEAKDAGLTGKDNWKKYTSDMLFARALTRGARRYAPGIFGGAPVYTPDELGADTDEEGNIIEGEVTRYQSNGHAGKPEVEAPTPASAPAPVADLSPPMPTAAMKKKFHALGESLYGADGWDDKRPELVRAISGKRQDGPTVKSSNELYRAEMQNLIDGMTERLQPAE